MPSSKQTDVKTAARAAIDQLPNDATWDDVMYRLYVRQKIDAGLRDVENGHTVTTTEVRRRFGLTDEG
jgi:predicted transcriptional regulator